ncbi:hypothetical protein LguiB_002081 [Lonicera macranthoides]
MPEPKPQIPAIIAMKGQACTGKSKWARFLATALQCPVIDQDDFLSSMSTLHHHHNSQILDDIAFEAACRSAITHLRLKFKVIVDSPLSHRTRLDQLIQLSATTSARLIIVECRPRDLYEWEEWLEGRDTSSGDYWHKPSTWEDLQDACEENPDYDDSDVSKLIVDTSVNVPPYQLHFAVDEFIDSLEVRREELPQWIPDIMRAGDDKITEIEEEQQIYTNFLFFKFSYDWKENADKVSCGKCLGPISDSIYNCNQFRVLLHKKCAESSQSVKISHSDTLRFFPETSDYNFLSTRRCNRCAEQNKSFSSDCEGCLFETHLKCDILPTVVHHEGHEHPLLFRISPISEDTLFTAFQCNACGDPGMHVSYFCNICNFKVHVKCLFLPRFMKNIHHRHVLMRKCSFQLDGSEVLCDGCETRRNPKYWIYNCDDPECDFSCHLNCKTFL